VSVIVRALPVATGIADTIICGHTIVCVVVYARVVIPPVPFGVEYMAPVALCSNIQNGSVPRAKNGVIASIVVGPSTSPGIGATGAGVLAAGFSVLIGDELRTHPERIRRKIQRKERIFI
jgi:hypothetical protein